MYLNYYYSYCTAIHVAILKFRVEGLLKESNRVEGLLKESNRVEGLLKESNRVEGLKNLIEWRG